MSLDFQVAFPGCCENLGIWMAMSVDVAAARASGIVLKGNLPDCNLKTKGWFYV